MINTITILTLIASTFLTGIFLDPFIPNIGDTRLAKEFICFTAALLIAFYGFKDLSIKVVNKWITAFVIYSIIALPLHPHFRLVLWHQDINGFWNYPVILNLVVYFMMFLTIANAKLDIERIFKVIFYCGFLSAFYSLIQFLNIDQLFVLLPKEVVLGSTAPNMTAFVGQNTLAGAFIAMTLPFAFSIKDKPIKILGICVMVLAIFLIQSKTAIASMVIGLILYGILREERRRWVELTGVILIILALGFSAYKIKHHERIIQDNGRFTIWSDVIKDISGPQIVDDVPPNSSVFIKNAIEINNKRTWLLTGVGPGAFSYVYPNKNNSPWYEAHNEPLQVMYGWGFIGLVLVFCLLFEMFLFVHDKLYSRRMVIVLVSFIIILINSLTNFVFQVDPTRFFTVLLMGLIYNQYLTSGRKLRKGE